MKTARFSWGELRILVPRAQPSQRRADGGHGELRSAVQAARDDVLDGHGHLYRRPKAPRQPGQVEHARPGRRRLVTDQQEARISIAIGEWAIRPSGDFTV